MMRIGCIIASICASLLQISTGHELCDNGYPPQDRSDTVFELCGVYKQNGCCDKEMEGVVAQDYRNAVASKHIRASCRKLIAEVFCQTCSPKSAHLFEGAFTEARRYPMLCRDFCSNLRTECGADTVNEIFGAEICDQHEDDIYCYPKTDMMDANHESSDSDSSDCIPVCLEKIVSGVKNIVDGAFPPDKSNRLFLVQQDGIVWELNSERKKNPEPFLDISEKIQRSRRTDERGLLSMVFHPNFMQNKLIYLFYNPAGGSSVRSRVVKMKVSDAGSPMKVDSYTEEIIIEYEKPESNHNGGQLMFGNDGYLYITVGDGGGAGDQHGVNGNGQSLTTFLGKILRIDVNVASGYKIPDDNPFVHESDEIKKEIFAYGLRNPWRMSIDRTTGTIFTGDVGQKNVEEVDIVVKGGNYGWRIYEGDQCYDKKICENFDVENIIDPIHTYTHSDGKSVIGGYVYRGSTIPSLRGKYVFGDLDKSPLWALEKNGVSWKKRDICIGRQACPPTTESVNPRKKLFGFTEDEKGEMYFFVADTTWESVNDGIVYKLVPPSV